MRINRIYLRNFGKFKEVNIDLSNSKCIAIVGDNGTGKTFLLETIAACLYGKYPSRFGSLHDFMNDDSSSMEIDITTDNKDIKIVRKLTFVGSKKDTEAYIFDKSNDKMLCGPKSTDVNNYISNNVMQYKLFMASIFSCQRNEYDICEEAPESRREILSQLINLDLQQKASDISEDKRKYYENICNEVLNTIPIIKHDIIDIQEVNKQIIELQLRLDSMPTVANIADRIASLRKRVSEINDIKNRKVLFEELDVINQYIKSIPVEDIEKFNIIGTDIDIISDISIPCGKDLYDRCHLAQKYGRKVTDIQLVLSKLSNAEKESLLNKSRDFHAKIERQKLLCNIVNGYNKLESIEDEPAILAELEELLTSNETTKYREDIASQIATLRYRMGKSNEATTALEVLDAKLHEASKLVEIYTILRDTWGKKGTQAHLLQDMINDISIFANEALEKLDVPMSIGIDTRKQLVSGSQKESIVIMANNVGRSMEYRNLSGGEARIFQFAVRYGLCKYMKAHMDTAILLIDETFDKLDDIRSSSMGMLIDSMVASIDQIIFVSHNLPPVRKLDTILSIENTIGITSNVVVKRI